MRCEQAAPARCAVQHGTLPANRWEDQGSANLCADEGRGFFSEVGIEDNQALGRRSFVSSVPLGDYSHGVQLPKP